MLMRCVRQYEDIEEINKYSKDPQIRPPMIFVKSGFLNETHLLVHCNLILKQVVLIVSVVLI